MHTNKFIILRGPSASGKTTIADKLFKHAKNRVAIIHQDYYRFIFKPAGLGSKPNSTVIHDMIEHNTAAALQAGYDVILEGILSVRSYQKIIERLIALHKGQSNMFYFDISFEETVRRHQTKRERDSYGAEQMREWYPGSHKSGHELETLLHETMSEEQIFKKIAEVSGIELA